MVQRLVGVSESDEVLTISNRPDASASAQRNTQVVFFFVGYVCANAARFIQGSLWSDSDALARSLDEHVRIRDECLARFQDRGWMEDPFPERW